MMSSEVSKQECWGGGEVFNSHDIQELLTTKLGLVSKDVAVWANTVAMNHYNHTRSRNYVLE